MTAISQAEIKRINTTSTKITGDTESVLECLYPSARELYEAGKLKIGAKVRIRGVPFSRQGVVETLAPLSILPLW